MIITLANSNNDNPLRHTDTEKEGKYFIDYERLFRTEYYVVRGFLKTYNTSEFQHSARVLFSIFTHARNIINITTQCPIIHPKWFRNEHTTYYIINY